MMRRLTISVTLGFLLALAIPARAQTTETQDEVKNAVVKEKDKTAQVRKAAQDVLDQGKRENAS